ncbi:uncharacterized protein I303_102961 [Kwoniella dejecticola CBS 10117]|uniref:EKC/KEOPS complex subunit CGI121 n=1 Tax=Kwoniella dejecticola CBS 10117 TaxID=1296121 RepID=A0A1A6AA81_9TREE|nr:uncharacterized protein I303_02980 [Kwoniella dejecticola CBS 10117]OBR86958.1 hypothetical protein I303_02980 [Kwoniella dejecticola CBS 10117]
MESYNLPSFPSEYSSIHICLFSNVTNSAEIKKRLVQAAITQGEEGDQLRREVDFGFLEADVLVSKEHLLTSIMTTLLYAFPSSSNASLSARNSTAPGPIPNLDPLTISESPESQVRFEPKTRTHNLHSELLLSLSPNNNITDSIRRHGISDKTTNLVIVKITDGQQTPENVYSSIMNIVEGELVNLDKIEEVTDWAKVDKIYKLSELNSLKSSNPDVLSKKRTAVVSAVGVKNVM